MKTKIPLKPSSTLLLLLIFHNLIWVSFCSDQEPIALKGIDAGHPAIDVTPVPIHSTSQGSKDIEFCKRVPVHGLLRIKVQNCAKDIKFCKRVPVHGVSRIKVQNYAKAYRVMVVPSVVIPDKWHSKIHICFHQNASLGLCQCEQDGWKSVHKGLWSSTMSTYEQRFIDVKFVGGVSGSVTVTLDEVSQGWRYVLLAVGTTLLFLAPVVSEWVPFYYTSSMAIGVFAVVLILLYQGMKLLSTGRKSAFYLSMSTSLIGAGSSLVHYVAVFDNSILSNFGFSQEMQNPVSVFLLLLIILLGAGLGYWLVRKYVISEDGDVDDGVAQFIKWAMRVIAVTCIFLGMKLLPTGRKSAFYLSMYTSLIGAGSFLVHYVAVFVNSILSNFGFSQEMQNLVSVFLLLLIILLGAGLGYWLVRKYVISEDGDVDDGVAQFIKWAMRVIAVTCLFLSSIDTPLATAAVITCLTLYYVVTSIQWQDVEAPSLNMPKLWQWSGQRTPKFGRAEFLSRPKNVSPFRNQWNALSNSFAWSDSPVKGTLNTSGDRGSTGGSQDDLYSMLHRTSNRKRFSKKEWEEFTEESTRDSVNELCSSVEFTEWVIKNANRIKLLPDNGSDDEVSWSDSTDGYLVKNADRKIYHESNKCINISCFQLNNFSNIS